jgi:hypothetical protein
MRNAFIIFLFITCAGFGLGLTEASWDGKVYVYMGRERGPAAVKSIKDYSALDGGSLSKTAHAQLLADAHMDREDGYLGVKLGQILVKTESGARDFACAAGGRPGVYDRIQLTFMGEGITEGDSPPKMIVDAKCRSTFALERLDAVWIPMADIVSLPPKNQDLRSRGEEPTFIKLEHMPSAWPETWSLYEVRLYKETNPESFFKVGAGDILKGDYKSLGFEWKLPRR